jgi:hypothetical protein
VTEIPQHIHANRSPRCGNCSCIYEVADSLGKSIKSEMQPDIKHRVDSFRGQADCLGPKFSLLNILALATTAISGKMLYNTNVNANFYYYDPDGTLLATASHRQGKDPIILPATINTLQEDDSSL